MSWAVGPQVSRPLIRGLWGSHKGLLSTDEGQKGEQFLLSVYHISVYHIYVYTFSVIFSLPLPPITQMLAGSPLLCRDTDLDSTTSIAFGGLKFSLEFLPSPSDYCL